MTVYTLDEIEKYIQDELKVTSLAFSLLEKFIFPLLRRPVLPLTYPDLLSILMLSTQYRIILGLGKLLDNTTDKKNIHFKCFLKTAEALPIKDKDSVLWKKFLNEASNFKAKIDNLCNELNPVRNRKVAHLMPIKPDANHKRWDEWSKVLEEMKKIFDLYRAAKGVQPVEYADTELGDQIDQFFRQCGL